MKIIVRKENETIAAVDLRQEVVYLGRSKKNHIVLSDAGVSRRHAKIFIKDEQIHLEDLKTPNGTKCNGRKVHQCAITEADKVQIGPYVITIEDDFNENTLDITLQGTEAEIQATDVDIPEAGDRTAVLQDMGELTPAEVLPYEHNARIVRIDVPGEEIALSKDSITIGSAETCDVMVKDDDVTLAHATLQKTLEGYVIQDDAESTGTFVDGVPVRERLLENHDVISIGNAKFEYLEGPSRSMTQKTGVLERKPTQMLRNPLAQVDVSQWLSDWRILIPSGVAVGLLFVWITSPPGPPQSAKETIQPEVVQESTRITLHNLDRARKLFAAGEYDRAEARLRDLLDKVSPNNPEALALLDQIEEIRSEKREKDERNRKVKEETEEQVQELLKEGDSFAQQKKYAWARDKYERALEIDTSHEQAKAALADLKKKEAEEEKLKRAQRQSNKVLAGQYEKGIQKFEVGDFAAAETLLAKVAAKRGHPNQSSAKKLLAEIRKELDKNFQNQLNSTTALLESGEVLQAHEESKELLKTYPRRKEAITLQKRVETELLAQAKKRYMEGITFLEVAEDSDAALERFEEVLKYAPDKSSEYHKKARKKITEIRTSLQN